MVGLVRSSNLRGRGGAGFPTGLKWSFLPEDHPGPIYFCVNADESEPGTFVNRVQMELDPHQVLEGIILSCYATRAAHGLHLSALRVSACVCQRMQAAIDECYAAGYLGKNILGSGFSLDVYIHRGAAAYVCGEETGLIESLEGKRAWPRIKPPFPAVEGLFRKPTVVNNVETLACVTHILDRGVDWFRSMGTPPDPQRSPRPRQLRAEALRPERPREPPRLLRGAAGLTVPRADRGVRRRRVEGPQGQGGRPRRPEHRRADRRPSSTRRWTSPGRCKAGCLGLGTACVVVLDETYSMVDFLHNSCRFFAHESCGQCTPCREGTHWALEMLERIKAGRGRLKDLDLLLEIGDFDRHHPRHDDLRPGRRGRLADQERDPQVSRRVRGVHPAHQPGRLRSDGTSAGDGSGP